MSDFIIIKIFLHRFEAEMAQGLLDEQGITSRIDADDCGGRRPEIAFGRVRLLVLKEDADKAKEIISILDTS